MFILVFECLVSSRRQQRGIKKLKSSTVTVKERNKTQEGSQRPQMIHKNDNLCIFFVSGENIFLGFLFSGGKERLNPVGKVCNS